MRSILSGARIATRTGSLRAGRDRQVLLVSGLAPRALASTSAALFPAILPALVPHRRRIASAAAAAALALLALTGCGAPAQDGIVCTSAGACAAGLCVAGRCRPPDKVPTPADSLRVLLPPRDLAVLTRGGPSGGGPALPEAVMLGRDEGGGVVMLLRFAATWRDDAEIASAFVVLDPTPGAAPPRASPAVEVARILEPWSPSTASWGRQPRLSLPERAGLLKAQPPSPARVDVTRFVREWAKRRPDDHGIALLIDGDDATGSAYSMGVTDGAGPLLEVYVR
jgi:hypothetical protein